MRAIRNTSDGVRLLDVAPSDATGIADPVTVQPISVGVCGSDLHMIAMGLRA